MKNNLALTGSALIIAVVGAVVGATGSSDIVHWLGAAIAIVGAIGLGVSIGLNVKR